MMQRSQHPRLEFTLPLQQQLITEHTRSRYPIIGGAMYPCSNPELVAAVSEAGGIGIVQPISLTYVNKYNFREGLRYIRSLTKNPIGLNLLIEKSSQIYLEKNKQWLQIALEEGVRFFITALGDPSWVMDIAGKSGGIVYHDVTERKWAEKAVKAGVHGLICVNSRAGGHAGTRTPDELFRELRDFNLPLVCAGGIGTGEEFCEALKTGYAGVQVGTRFIATRECTAHADYKAAIVQARASDIVLTEKLTGVPVAVINTGYMKERGAATGNLTGFLLRHPLLKHWTRAAFSLRSIWQLKRSLNKGNQYKEFYQAGKSVEGINSVTSVQDVITSFASCAKKQNLL